VKDATMKYMTFKTLLCTATLLICGWLVAWPLIMNTWARSHWSQVDCQKGALAGKYVYKWQDQVYISARQNFWDIGGKADHGSSHDFATKGTSDGTCWVDPGDPEYPVHYLDTMTNWSGATQRLVASVLLLIVAGIIYVVEIRRSAAKAAALTSTQKVP
jgi:hypothetical protein